MALRAKLIMVKELKEKLLNKAEPFKPVNTEEVKGNKQGGKCMTTKEMIYVLDKEKECIQIRTTNQCDKDCSHCSCHMEPSSLLDAFERIINYIFQMDRHSTKKGGF